MNLSCPECANSMRVIVDQEVEIDVCDHCLSVWLDAGELEKLATTTNGMHEYAIEGAAKESFCPRCLQQNLISWANSSSQLKSCPMCSGILISGETLLVHRDQANLHKPQNLNDTTELSAAQKQSGLSPFDMAAAGEVLVWILEAITVS